MLITTCLSPAGAAGFEPATAAAGSSRWAYGNIPGPSGDPAGRFIAHAQHGQAGSSRGFAAGWDTVDRPLALQLESELDEERRRGREVVDHNAHVLHSYAHWQL